MSERNKIVVLGAAESGVGAALLAKAKGFDVFVSDAGKISATFKKKLDDNKISYEEGQHTEIKIFDTKEIIKSPGIPDKSELIKNAKKNKIKIISEIEFAGRYAKGKKICITGTNGKTTTVTLLHKLFIKLGYRTGLLSTVENKINEEIIPSTHTTPDAVSLNALLQKMVEVNCTHCFIEVSSHAVVQHRIAGLHFKGAIFTNITHDHLDYHKTFDEYIRVKKAFFDGLTSEAFAISNHDDKRGEVMLQNTKAKKQY